jgi:phage terminase small subunit
MLLRRNPPARATSAVLPSDCPSFTGLDEREALFVVEYVTRAGLTGAGADAALAAGYSNGNRNGAHSMASRLLRRPTVLRAIKDETAGRLARSAPLGVAVLEDLARSARSEQVRLAAANSLIDRGYGPVVSRSASANLSVNAGIEELLDKLERQERRDPPIDVTPSATD